MQIKLNEDIRQELHTYALSIGVNIKVIKYNPITKVADLTFEAPPTETQIQQIRDQIPILMQKYRLSGIDAFDPLLTNVTPEQIDAHIDLNIIDLASAKAYLKRLTRAVLFLYKREMEL